MELGEENYLQRVLSHDTGKLEGEYKIIILTEVYKPFESLNQSSYLTVRPRTH
jgi:hypothetical protein